MKADWSKLRADVVSALTVALVGLPQCLAYAMMSGLPPAYGLVTAAVPGFVAALVGQSPHIITGPTNTTGLLILAALTPYLGENGLLTADGLGALATLTLLAGVLRLLASYAGGAALVDFIPESVLAGFTAGAGVLIVVMQFDEALGVTGVRGGSLTGELREVMSRLAGGEFAWPAAVATLATVVAVVVAKRVAPRFPMALVAVVALTAIALAFGLDARAGLPIVSDRATVPTGWPAGALPDLDPALVRSFLGPAGAIALLGTMELAVSARREGARPNMSREIAAQGLANVVGAFTSAFPASASLTRSALLKLGGASSRFAAAVAALTVVPILFFGTSFVAALPQASLAGVLIVTAWGMINVPRLRRIWRSSIRARSLLGVTLLTTLLFPLEWAIFIGVGLGIGLHLAQGRKPRVLALVPTADRRLVPCDRAEDAERRLVLEVSGDGHFAASSVLGERLEASVPRACRLLVVDLTHARALGYATLIVLERLDEAQRQRGGELRLAGVSASFGRLLRATGSPLWFSPYRREPLKSIWQALDGDRTPEPDEGEARGSGDPVTARTGS